MKGLTNAFDNWMKAVDLVIIYLLCLLANKTGRSLVAKIRNPKLQSPKPPHKNGPEEAFKQVDQKNAPGTTSQGVNRYA